MSEVACQEKELAHTFPTVCAQVSVRTAISQLCEIYFSKWSRNRFFFFFLPAKPQTATASQWKSFTLSASHKNFASFPAHSVLLPLFFQVQTHHICSIPPFFPSFLVSSTFL